MSRNPMPFYSAAGFTTTSRNNKSGLPNARMAESVYTAKMYDELIIYV